MLHTRSGVIQERRANLFPTLRHRRSELNAFLKSNLMITWSSGMFDTYRRVAWMAASAPPGTLNPSCNGAKLAIVGLAMTHVLAHLAARRRNV